jgi:hypothetical protein
VHSAAAPRTSHGNMRNYTEPKPISWVKPVQVEFSSSNFTVQDHILSTGGDALKLRQGPTQHHPSAPNLIKDNYAVHMPTWNPAKFVGLAYQGKDIVFRFIK